MTIKANQKRSGAAVLVALSLLSACPPKPVEPKVDPSLMPADQHLLRVAMALRGVRPTADELAQVRQNPSAIDGIVDGYLETPEFGATLREMHSEQWLTNVDPVIFPIGFRPIGALAGMTATDVNLPVTESPGRYVEHVVMNDRPYHEIVTGDYAFTDRVNAVIFGLQFDADGDTWQESQFQDGRELAGVLSDSMLFTRHSSTYSNKNRGRAAQVSRALLCTDFLARQVELEADIDLGDEEAVQNAIQFNPTCVSCHQTLDPLAATFSPYLPIYVPGFLTNYPVPFLVGAAGNAMRTAEEAFFGEPSHGIRDLGILVATDPRFSMCAVRRFKSYLMQQDQEALTVQELSPYLDVFMSEGMDAKALVKALVLSDEFRRATPATVDGVETDANGVLKARPEALARLIEQATGHRWRTNLPFDFGGGPIGQVDLMNDALFGFKVLAGGTDGQGVPRPATTMNATAMLVLRGLAGHAAPEVVAGDFGVDRDERRLLDSVDDDTRDEAAIREQLKRIEEKLYGKTTSESVDAAYALFAESLAASNDVTRAWNVTLFGMLQDVRMATY